MVELQRLGLKVFVKNPSSVKIRDFIALFHSWIQQQIVEEHLLIDVHDYSHVFSGPGILLVAHEGNFSMDLAENRAGLLYCRKQDTNGSLGERIKTIFQTTLRVCRLIEDSSDLPGLKFRTDEFLVIANDRLLAPNTNQTFQQIQPELSEFMSRFLGESNFTLAHREDSRERFAVLAKTPSDPGIRELLVRLS